MSIQFLSPPLYNFSPEHSRALCVDFDHTVFFTTRFAHVIRDAFVSAGVHPDAFEKIHQSFTTTHQMFDPDAFIDAIPFSDTSALHAALQLVLAHHTAQCVFNDVHDFFRRHAPAFDLFIVTRGQEKWQREKIVNCHFQSPFRVVITQEKKSNVFRFIVPRYTYVAYIDDAPHHLEDVKKACPSVETFLICRPDDHPHAQTFSTTAVDHQLKNLSVNIT